MGPAKNEKEKNAQQGELDFREICENLYDGVHVTDGNGTVLFINRAYTRTTGIVPAEILGKTVADIEREHKLYQGAVTNQVLEKKKRVDSVATILGLDKEVLVTGVPVFRPDGTIKMVVTSTRDFPELKQMEQNLLSVTEESRKAQEELAYLRQQQSGGKVLYYRSRAMQSVLDLVHTVAPTDVTVLITGESGTGKELIANELYLNSKRNGKPFIKVNCAAIPPELLESELFGYEEGAFTGARRSGKAGMFELANGGVLLLDEIGDMPMALQSKLLRVLQQRELMRIGGSRSVKLDIRIIASTNMDLRSAIEQGHFREDLYYRLNVVPIVLKPLREREEDIPYLAQQFCRQFNKKYGKHVEIGPDAMELLKQYRWPGNVRELENMIERMVVTHDNGVISREMIYGNLNICGSLPEQDHHTGTLKQQVAEFEQKLIRQAIQREGSLRKAARALGIDHSTLVKKCQRFADSADSVNFFTDR